MSTSKTYYFGSFKIPQKLYDQCQTVIGQVREHPGNKTVKRNLITVIQALTRTGIRFYFLRPVALCKVNKVSEGAAKATFNSSISAINAMVKRAILMIDEKQMLIIADHVDDVLNIIEVEEAED